MAEKAKISEEKQAAASYVLSFYNEVTQLTHNHALYINLLLELENKYKGLDLAKMDDETKQTLIQSVQATRYYVHKSYIQYKTIIVGLKEKEDPKILTAYEKVKANFIIVASDLEAFVVLLNNVLMQKVIKSLLENSTDVVNKIYE